MSSTLFRTEALERRKARLEGDVILTRSISLSLVTVLLTAITIALVIWAVFGSYSRTETVPGALDPDGVLSKVYAERPGEIIWLGVKDGDLVKAGQAIATVRIEQPLANGRSPGRERLISVAEQARLTDEQLRLEDASSTAERARLTRLISELGQEHDQLAAQVDLQRQAVASTHNSFDALTGLVDRGFVTHTDYEQRRQVWLSASTQLQALIQQVAQLAERRSDAESQLTKLPGDHAAKVASLHSTLDDLDQRRVDVEGAQSYTIAAPIAGRVTALQTAAGRSSNGQQPLLAIVPQGAKMEVTLYAPSRAVGFARPGQEVRLLYDAFPYQRFGTFSGHIVAISHSVLTPAEADAPVKLEEPVYEVKVALDRQMVNAFGQNLALQPGMTLTADIVLDRRSFLDWLLEPIRAVTARS